MCRRYGKRVYQIVRSRLGRRLRARVETADVAQDAMVEIVEHARSQDHRRQTTLPVGHRRERRPGQNSLLPRRALPAANRHADIGRRDFRLCEKFFIEALEVALRDRFTADFRSNATERKYPNFPGIAPISAFFAGMLAPRLVVSRDVKKVWGFPSQQRRQR